MDGLFHLDDVIIQVTHCFLQAVVDKAQGCVVHYYEVHRSVPVVRGQLDGCFLLVVDVFLDNFFLSFGSKALVLSGAFGIQISCYQRVAAFSVGTYTVYAQYILDARTVGGGEDSLPPLFCQEAYDRMSYRRRWHTVC